MSSVKCRKCGLVNFATQDACRRCGATLRNRATVTPVAPTAAQPVTASANEQHTAFPPPTGYQQAARPTVQSVAPEQSFATSQMSLEDHQAIQAAAALPQQSQPPAQWQAYHPESQNQAPQQATQPAPAWRPPNQPPAQWPAANQPPAQWPAPAQAGAYAPAANQAPGGYGDAPPEAAPYAAAARFATGPYNAGMASGFPPQPKLKQGMAIFSLVLGGIGIITLGGLGLGAITGLILGIVAIVKSNKHPDEYGGKALAAVGLVLNGIGLLFLPIIAAIAIPNFLMARQAANEASAISTLRAILVAEDTYRSTSANRQFGDLQQLSRAGLLPDQVQAGKSGYRFDVRLRTIGSGPTAQSTFDAFATPMSYNSTGRRSYYATGDFVIRGADKNGAPGNSGDPPLGYSSQPAMPRQY